MPVDVGTGINPLYRATLRRYVGQFLLESHTAGTMRHGITPTPQRIKRHPTPFPDPINGWRLLGWLMSTHCRIIPIGMAAGIGWMLSQAAVPWVLGRAVDEGIAPGDVGRLSLWLAGLLLLALCEAIFGNLRHWMAVRLYSDTKRLVTETVSDRLFRENSDLAEVRTPGQILNHLDFDANQLGLAMDVMLRGAASVVTFLVVASLLFSMSMPLGLIVILGLPPMVLMMVPLWRPLEQRATQEQWRMASLTSLATDLLSGLRILKGFGGERTALARYREQAAEVRSAAVRVAWLDAGWDLFRVVVPGLMLFAVVWTGGYLVLEGRLSAGELVTAFGFAGYLVVPVSTFGEVGNKWARARAASNRIAATLSAERAQDDSGRPGSGIDLSSLRGLQVGLVAASPDRKTACLNRLPHEVDRAWGPETKLLMEQDAFLFAGTLRSNLTLANAAANDEECIQAMHRVAADDLLDRPGLDGPVTSQGRSLSGGQCQRVALARCLLFDPDVLILDEPTSALDAYTEALFAERFPAARGGRTTLIFTHSTQLLGVLDLIIFINADGTVLSGTHANLMTREPEYRKALAITTPTRIPSGVGGVA